MGIFAWLQRPAPPRKAASYRPRVEQLEDRALMSFDPSGQEQYLLELTNRMRMAPAAELGRLLNSNDAYVRSALDFFGVDRQQLDEQWAALAPAAPLAFNPALWQTARAHSAAMLQFDLQAHQLPGEGTLKQRVAAAGYAGTYVGENIYAYAENVFYAHAGMAIDWGFGPGGIQDPAWHQVNIMNPRFRDIGIGIVAAPPGSGVSTGPLLVTQDFGQRTVVGPAQLVGVVYQDSNRDGFYSIGEGLAGVTVTVTGPAGTFTTTTRTAGGYQLPLPPGDYTVTFRGDRLAETPAAAVTVAGDNVKLDYRGLPLPTVQFAGAAGRLGEQGGSLRVPVVLSNPSDRQVSVGYAVVGGTARAGLDYGLSHGVVTFQPGQTRAWVSIPLINDRLDEPAETIRVVLQSPVGASLGSAAGQTWIIVDDDPPPVVTVAPLAQGASRSVAVQVALSAPSAWTVSVPYAVHGGGLERVGFVTFTPGQRVQWLTLTPLRAGPVRVSLVQPRLARLGNPSWCVFSS